MNGTHPAQVRRAHKSIEFPTYNMIEPGKVLPMAIAVRPWQYLRPQVSGDHDIDDSNCIGDVHRGGLVTPNAPGELYRSIPAL
jgi:hypothetical protein